MQKYLYFWIFFLAIEALRSGYNTCKEYQAAGHNTDHAQKTGNVIKFHGGIKETITCTLAAALGLFTSPTFYFIETLLYIPAAIVLYFIS